VRSGIVHRGFLLCRLALAFNAAATHRLASRRCPPFIFGVCGFNEASAIQCTEVQLKAETIKCYARQFERAKGNNSFESYALLAAMQR
jgi:hypothetical protein